MDQSVSTSPLIKPYVQRRFKWIQSRLGSGHKAGFTHHGLDTRVHSSSSPPCPWAKCSEHKTRAMNAFNERSFASKTQSIHILLSPGGALNPRGSRPHKPNTVFLSIISITWSLNVHDISLAIVHHHVRCVAAVATDAVSRINWSAATLSRP